MWDAIPGRHDGQHKAANSALESFEARTPAPASARPQPFARVVSRRGGGGLYDVGGERGGEADGEVAVVAAGLFDELVVFATLKSDVEGVDRVVTRLSGQSGQARSTGSVDEGVHA